MPSVFLLTLGCPKNEADSDSFAGCFSAAGWEILDNSDKADILLLNTCAFIQPAVEESLEAINEAVEWKNSKAGRKLILTGCLPGRYRDDNSGGLEDFDLITGPGDTAALRKYLSTSDFSGPVPVESIYHRYLKISEGCSNDCSYCTIPLIRGGRADRSFEDILNDAEYLVKQGALEIGIVGQDTGSWRSSRGSVFQLISRLASTYPHIWFRLYYIHPAHFPDEFLSLIEKYSNIMPYIDMPIQHVSSAVLERMGRPYSEEYLRKMFESFDKSKIELSVRTTVIVGYPGETDADFETLIEFLSDYDCLRTISAFPYWPEEGTREFSRKTADNIPGSNTVQSRLMRIGDVADQIYTVWAEKLEGKVIEVLADTAELGHGRLDAPVVDGVCTFDRAVEPGQVIKCRVSECFGSEMLVEVLR
ncbi:MAG: MiaB/RimO family radical SAM methylthiotransferase [Candidatus Fermentibacteraceae bacterium]|nr:MiaB/RimO family radical SAM methylthiotransferase [Candidatus Fermentibacteraceae bacterium]